MHVVRVVGKKGQLVIPKDIREYLGIREGSKIIFEVKGDRIIMRTQKDEGFLDEFCSAVKKKLKEEVDLEKLYYAQIEERATP